MIKYFFFKNDKIFFKLFKCQNQNEYFFQVANMESAQTLVFLLKDSIPSKQLGRNILSYIRTNKYIRFPKGSALGDVDHMTAFWDKLANDLKQ